MDYSAFAPPWGALLSRHVVYSILHRILYFLPIEGSLLVVEERREADDHIA